MYKGDPKRLTANFSLETMRLEGSGMTYLKCWSKKKKKGQLRHLYPAKKLLNKDKNQDIPR